MRTQSLVVVGLISCSVLLSLSAACGSDPSDTGEPLDASAPGDARPGAVDASDAARDTSTSLQDTGADAISDAGARDAADGSAWIDGGDGGDASDASDASSAHDAAPDASPDAAPPPDAGPLACNGATPLCARRFDQVSYPTTHNAMSNSDDGFIGPNQHHTITRQLHDGIRALMLDTHYDGTVPSLCHGYCELGKKPLVTGLSEIKAFLDANPREVVTIIFESYITAADTKTSFEGAGLLARTYAHDVAQPWPTLQTLIQADQRVVVFTDNGGGTYPWYMDMWVHEFETDYSNKTKADLDCRPNRGVSTNALFILNHFLTNPIASELLAGQVNYDPFFLDKANECAAKYHHIPNFVTVDFYDLGDVLTVSRTLNGL